MKNCLLREIYVFLDVDREGGSPLPRQGDAGETYTDDARTEESTVTRHFQESETIYCSDCK